MLFWDRNLWGVVPGHPRNQLLLRQVAFQNLELALFMLHLGWALYCIIRLYDWCFQFCLSILDVRSFLGHQYSFSDGHANFTLSQCILLRELKWIEIDKEGLGVFAAGALWFLPHRAPLVLVLDKLVFGHLSLSEESSINVDSEGLSNLWNFIDIVGVNVELVICFEKVDRHGFDGELIVLLQAQPIPVKPNRKLILVEHLYGHQLLNLVLMVTLNFELEPESLFLTSDLGPKLV